MLGPLLFLHFVNNLPTYVVSKCKYFVDDLNIYLNLRHSNIVDMSSDLSSFQSDIDTMVRGGLRLNLGDCNPILHYSFCT